jgi:hypothetical protein
MRYIYSKLRYMGDKKNVWNIVHFHTKVCETLALEEIEEDSTDWNESFEMYEMENSNKVDSKTSKKKKIEMESEEEETSIRELGNTKTNKKESRGKGSDMIDVDDMEENSSESDNYTMEVDKLEQSSDLHSKPERLQQKRNKKKKNENYNVVRQVALYIQSR